VTGEGDQANGAVQVKFIAVGRGENGNEAFSCNTLLALKCAVRGNRIGNSESGLRIIQESLANAKASARQQWMHEGSWRRNLPQYQRNEDNVE